MQCYKCGLPMFLSAVSVSPQCRCWAQYNPAPDAAQGNGCYPAKPLTADDVRRIVREEWAKLEAESKQRQE